MIICYWFSSIVFSAMTVSCENCLKMSVYFALSPSGIIYHCDLSEPNPKPTVFREVKVKGIKQEDYQTHQVM